MKALSILTLLILFVLFSLAPVEAAGPSQRVKGSNIDIRGDYEEEDPYDKEYRNIRNLQNGFKHKKRTLRKMKVVAEKLAEDHKDFLVEKIEYEREIEQFNRQVKCASEPNTPGCEAFFKDLGIQKGASRYAQTVKRHIEARRSLLEGCYKRSNKRNGAINFIISIRKNGRVSHIAIEDMKNYKDRKVLRCVSHIIQKIQFPATDSGKNVKVRTPFKFRSRKYAYNRR